MKTIVSVLFALGLTSLLQAQQLPNPAENPPVNRQRLRTLGMVTGTTYTLGLIGLDKLWYSNSPRQSFQFFNDNDEWNQVDKLGHFYSAFHISHLSSRGMQWCQIPENKADLWGAVIGFFVLLPIEIMDGYSADYGASPGDVLANTLGAGFYLGQKKLWNEIRITPKFSFQRSPYAHYRPQVLGDTFLSEILKDYNGQTYWLSFDLDKFIRFPAWLNLALGYGAEEMVFAREGANSLAGYSSYRQYYISLDLDLTGIPTQSVVLKTAFQLISMIKLPLPTLEFSKNGTQFHFLH